jgi:YD repeat-containing protein
VLTVWNAQGTITRQYDTLNRVIKYTDVNKNVVQYTYDAVGNLFKWAKHLLGI